MKDLLEKFGLSELFAYLCPGAILLCSLLLWVQPGDVAKDGWQSFVLAGFLVVLAYTLGLMVAAWSSEGAARYINRSRNLHNRWTLLRALNVWWHGIFHSVPDLPRGDSSVVHAQARLEREVLKRARVMGLSSLLHRTTWGLLQFFRAAVADEVGEKGKAVLVEAEAVHRRVLFAQGVALAMLLVALECGVRLVPCLVGLFTDWKAPLPAVPEIHWVWLVCLLVGGLATSYSLRVAAGRWWETEFALTCILLGLLPDEEE